MGEVAFLLESTSVAMSPSDIFGYGRVWWSDTIVAARPSDLILYVDVFEMLCLLVARNEARLSAALCRYRMGSYQEVLSQQRSQKLVTRGQSSRLGRRTRRTQWECKENNRSCGQMRDGWEDQILRVLGISEGLSGGAHMRHGWPRKHAEGCRLSSMTRKASQGNG